MQALPSDKRVSIYGNKNDIAKALEALLKYEEATPEQLTEEWKKQDLDLYMLVLQVIVGFDLHE